MKRLFVLLAACFACVVLQAQQLHWTPVDEGLYSGSTTVIAVVQVNGVEQTSTQMELAVFSGTECRGTAFTTEFPITHRFQAMVNVYGEVGHELTFKAYDHAINEELVMDPVVTVSFTEDGSGTLFSPLELNFKQQLQSYTITASAYPSAGGTVTGGGIFDEGTDCALAAIANTGYTFVNWTENGQAVSTSANYSFAVTGARTLVANFSLNSYAVAASANPLVGGTVTGGGTYNYGASCTLTATANTGYTFVNWTESGTQVSTNATYSFNVTGARTLVANFNQDVVDENITFADTNVKALCVANWDTNGDGELSYAEAAAVTSIGTLFKANTVITSFDELQFFIGVSSITTKAFYGCSNLTSITIPNAVTSIGEKAFNNCSSLAQITVAEGNAVFDSRDNCNAIIKKSNNKLIVGCKNTVVPNTVTSIGYYSFSGSHYLLSIEIPNSVTTIESGAFYYCSRLATIEIPNSVTIIKNGAFASSGVTTVTIGNSVETIETMAFYDCSNIISLTVLAETPPVLESGTYGHAFSSVNKAIPVYVPVGTLAAYQAAYGWSEFTNYQEVGCPSFEITATANPTAGGTITGAGTYTQGASCTLTTTPNAGYAFANWTEGNTVVSNEATYSFTVTGDRNLVANFVATGPITPHWTPVTGMLNNMTIEGVVLIDGVEQTSPTLELGAFCGDECRGTVLPFEDEGQWWYFILISGEDGDTITFRLFEHTTMQELESQFVGTIEFVADDDIDPYEFNFANNVTITALVNPANAGIVSGAGEYLIGSSATLTVAANEGYAFRNWTVDDNVVSTESTYTFTVTTAITVNANFDRVQNEVLPAGWNWWSTYIEQEGINGLTMLENGLGEAGIMVKAQNSYVKRRANGSWMGSLTGITNEDGYKVNVSSECTSNIVGTPVVASDHPITIKPNWTWIGYPMNIQQTVAAALSEYQPVVGDMIKGASGFAKYRSNGWMPSSFVLEPGKSYMYNSKATENKTLVYSTSRADIPDEIPVEKYWDNDIHAYPDNITMIAVVNFKGEELRDDHTELGAFVGDECRGSAKMFYDEETDRYLAMITIVGEDGDLIDFGIVNDKGTVIGSETLVTFHADEMIGDFYAPKEIVFDGTSSSGLKVYPNPVSRGQSVRLNFPEEESVAEVIITNTLGVVVRRDVTSGHEVQGLSVPGIYTMQVVCESGNKYHERIIVK